MKGIIFNELESMVESVMGQGAWDDVIDATNLQTEGGIFAGPKVYPDADLFALVGTIHEKTKLPVETLLVEFGKHLFPRLAVRYPMFIQPGMTAKDFLLTVHSTIHVEVRKLHPDAGLPTFSYEDPGPGSLVMIYQSPRKICDLFVGLLQGVGTYFKEDITFTQPLCTKQGHDKCRFEMKFAKANV